MGKSTRLNTPQKLGLAAAVLALGTSLILIALNDGERWTKASPQAQEAATRSNIFGVRLFKELAQEHKDANFVVSGTSAAIALALFNEGLGGTSREVLESALGYPGADDGVAAQAYGDLSETLNPSTGDTLLSANALFNHHEHALRSEYRDVASREFEAMLATRDFDDPATVVEVNRWASDNTKGLIPKVINYLSPVNAICLLNAIYFRGVWETEFDAHETRQELFHPESGEPFKVDTMNSEVRLAVHADESVMAVRLSFKGGRHSMVFVSPKLEGTLAALIESMDEEWWPTMLSRLKELEPEPWPVSLPKFEMRRRYELSPTLIRMGLSEALNSPDTSRMFESPYTNRVDVIQHCFLQVDEKGAKAAAVTHLSFNGTSTPFHPTFNRPFLFAIVDHDSGAVLFMGQVVDPRKD